MSKELIKLTKEQRISSIDLVNLINEFRKAEQGEKYKELKHYVFLKKIKKECETLKILGLGNEENFIAVDYEDKKGEKRPCYSIDKNGMLMLLNSESTFVRYKTTEYIENLEQKLKVIETPSYMIDDRVERAKVWITEEEARQALALENREQKEELKELRPKGVFFDLVLENKKYLNISDIAREFGLSGRKLNQILKDKGVQVKGENGKWTLTDEFENNGYTKILLKTNPITKQKVPVMFWTQKGRKFIKELLKEEEIFPITETGLIAK